MANAAVPVLLELLRSDDAEVRKAAVGALGHATARTPDASISV